MSDTEAFENASPLDEQADHHGAPGQYTGQGGVVQAAGREWAVGLVWESVASERKGATAQAREAAVLHYADLVAVRKKSQYALGSTATGHRRGMRSLAAALADNLDDQMLAAFAVDGGFYILAVRDEMILPTVDVLIADQSEAESLYYTLAQSSTWSVRIAPNSWSIPDTREELLADSLSGARGRVTLMPVSRAAQLVRYSGIGVGVLAAIGIVISYEHITAAREAAAQQDQLRQAAAMMASQRARALAEVKAVVMPWSGKPEGVVALDVCSQAILSAPIDVAGWEVTTLGCNPQTLTITESLKRAGGTINWIAPSLDRPGFKPVINISGGVGAANASVSWQIPAITPLYRKNAKTIDVDRVYTYLTKQFDEIGQPITMKVVAPPVAKKPAGRGTKSSPSEIELPTFRSLGIKFTTPLDPREFEKVLAPIPAIMLNNLTLTFSATGSQWDIDGTVYQEVMPAKKVLAKTNMPGLTGFKLPPGMRKE